MKMQFRPAATGGLSLEGELFSFPGGRYNDLVDALTQALAYKHVRSLWTDEAAENYNNLLFTFMASGVRLP